jgi:TonB family protein
VIRPFAAALSILMLGATPPPGVTPDRLTALAGTTWTCRNPAGALSALTFLQNGSAIAADEVRDGKSVARERFEPDPAGGWRVEHTTDYTAFTGHASAWTAAGLVADGSYAYLRGRVPAVTSRIRFDLLNDTTLRRTLATGEREPFNGVVCAKGDAPPEPSLCAVHDLPAVTLHAVEPDTPYEAMNARITGTVHVLVSLDADSRVTDATIVKSPSVILNASSLAAARRSTYRTAIHDCKPVPTQYIFSIEYSSP